MITTEEHIRSHADTINWSDLSKECDINSYSFEFIMEFKYEWDWRVISSSQKLNEKFIREHTDSLNWTLMSTHQDLSMNFIEEMSSHIDWILICTNKNYIHLPESEHFVRKFKDKVNWEYASKCMNMTERFLLEFEDNVDWHMASHYQDMSIDFQRQHKDKLYKVWKKQIAESRNNLNN